MKLKSDMAKMITTSFGVQLNPRDFTYFVSMTDKFLSLWGRAEDRVVKRVFPCKDLQEARDLVSRIRERKDTGMTRVHICTRFPYYPPSRYYVSYDLPEGAFTY